jgi:hypothetical protein
MKTTREILTDLDLIYGRNLLKEEKYKIVDYVKKYAKEYHESELKKLRVTDVSVSVCDCGNYSVEAYAPCCSLSCWHEKYE